MRRFLEFRFCLVLILLLCFLSILIDAQDTVDKLIISEVYLEEKNPINRWIEIYNPTGKSLTLFRFRPSNIRSIDVLPPDIRRKGGIEIKPNEFVILSADERTFRTNSNIKCKIIVIKTLKFLSNSGFIVLYTKDFEKTTFDGFRYGNPEYTISQKDIFGEQVINFSNDGKSWSRTIEFSESTSKNMNFIKTIPSPNSISK